MIRQAPVVRIPPLGGRPHGFLAARIGLVTERDIVEKDGGAEEVAFEWVENVVLAGDSACDAPKGVQVGTVVQRETGKAGGYS